ncbi:MAG: response regulator transcription factor [Anaerolineae bacterium]|nr:response regulator transcription factor [Anaerolineae bacterium]
MDERITILAVDDDPEHLSFFVDNLELGGYKVRRAENGLQAKRQIEAAPPDLMILDLCMPVMNGFDLLAWLREFSDLPVIILTALDEEEDKVRGLELGADDYLVKPVGSRELQARVRALLRRSYPPPAAGAPLPLYRNGRLSIDRALRKVYLEGEVVRMAPTLYQLLMVFVEHADCVLEHDYLLEQGWGTDSMLGGMSLLRANINRLRKIIEPDRRNPTYIVSVPRVGYYLKQHPPQPGSEGGA